MLQFEVGLGQDQGLLVGSDRAWRVGCKTLQLVLGQGGVEIGVELRAEGLRLANMELVVTRILLKPTSRLVPSGKYWL
ncbi:MAG TPA: hypothetical protein VEI01_00840 [Terriglobales bacterium]|nr:hypothetical protein [Terriglobales bacterium]